MFFTFGGLKYFDLHIAQTKGRRATKKSLKNNRKFFWKKLFGIKQANTNKTIKFISKHKN